MKKRKQKPAKFWQKAIVRAVGIPGYGSLFAAWVFLLGAAATVVYIWMSYPVVIVNQVSSSERAGFVGASWAELLFMLVMVIVAWTGVAYFSGKAVRWLAGLMKVKSQNLIPFKLTLLITGWLGLALVASIPSSEYGYLVLFSSAAAIAIGSLSFALEALLLKLWYLSDDTTW